ncbi:alpha/beta hydrolase [Mucilaginibacter robiniae]|uniref:Alpha/beta hydrolase n=1 Tax=Mucilaginibacter robiniae TaxID=2728022 RepID=A0A7L5E136_9SPHI|nr:subtype B tannase [Mucilaginibacter robiniae]QJD96218.1 alpha/beta hydrolase [Mucilaginibacter robiniae]
MKLSMFKKAALVPALLFPFASMSQGLTFNPQNYTVQEIAVNGKQMKVRAYEHVVYVAKPVDTVYQQMNIYIPEAYFNKGSINGYTAQTAPIFFPNQVGGYMPGRPGTAINAGRGPGPGGPAGMPPGGMPAGGMPPGGPGSNMGPGGNRVSTIAAALLNGYVVASPGARGRPTKDEKGIYTGKAPAAIVDLKAAVRYLKFNDKLMPGDASKIISNGTSAGGALSALLGATGNNKDYEPYLKAIGAADASDDIFAVSAYCPITNLDHADMAYEWQFNSVNTYKKINISMLDYKVQRTETAGELSSKEQVVSAQLKVLFPAYVNSLQLKGKQGQLLQLDKDGNGSFKNWVKSYVIASAQKVLDSGKDLSALKWLTITGGKVTGLDFDGYVHYMERMKTPPAFDALNLSTGENQLFGTATVDKAHFTKFSADNSAVKAVTADAIVVKMMNPMDYIGRADTKTSAHWRIRHGTKDKDTGLAVSVMLATLLQNKGYDVNLELPWDRPHSGDYDQNELFSWIDGISK